VGGVMPVLPEPRVSVITLGVSNLAAMVDFYTGVLGFEDRGIRGEIAFFNAGGVVLGLWDEAKLAADAGLSGTSEAGASRRFALAFNARSQEEVDVIFGRLAEAGVPITCPPHKAAWGGYSGYFADPEENLWEVVFNPFWQMDTGGMVRIPDRKER
jgi:hypothetical protein